MPDLNILEINGTEYTIVDGAAVQKAGDAMTGELNMGSNKITNLAAPTVDTDAATMGYVKNNAAPAGYGLGLEEPEKRVDDVNDAIETGTYWYPTGAANAPTNSGEWVHTESYGKRFKHQTAFVSYTGGNVVERWMLNGEWQPWEWRNPPMYPGVEYRTTERYNGQAVYAKAVNYGYIPAGENVIPHGIAGIDEVIGLDVINRSYGVFNNSKDVSSAANKTDVIVNSAWAMGGFVYIIKYTKS